MENENLQLFFVIVVLMVFICVGEWLESRKENRP